ncbi:porphobilinogen deaminase [Thermodesulfatator indicus DSM 15286]|uniref:Porphobilinogen deaminase n=1 Tax=Thermodesulfatator indicus (strain DSM 15286 / JCM 11887 / CIR29812) TaxID=667014 RepID=F8ACV8_THEID|nr:hydroxymethylbilane synthase [Thermodesulfatator indicus]AEH44749.1 porphobilinogen deaminase [Thermodesulfatator indicus DSM 15286]
MRKHIKVGTRGSKLALAQTNWVIGQIKERYPEIQVETVIIKTKGDKILDVPLAKVGGKGLFVKEIEDALLREEIDLAVHSMKDVPTELPEGLEIAIIPERESPYDVVISQGGESIDDLPSGATVGTSSLRRSAQLKAYRPDLKIENLRGNLDTRLRKLNEGLYHAIIVAQAGLIRLGLKEERAKPISPEIMLPAIGQGALAIEVRESDHDLKEGLSFLHHEETAICVAAERAFLATLEGGCQVPLAAFARLSGDNLTVEGLIADPSGETILKEELKGPKEEAQALGRKLAEILLGRGGRKILDEVYGRA